MPTKKFSALADLPVTSSPKKKSFDHPLDDVGQEQIAAVTGRKGGGGGSVRKTIFLSPQLIADVDAEAEAEYGHGQKMQFWQWLVEEGWRQYQAGERPKVAEERVVRKLR